MRTFLLLILTLWPITSAIAQSPIDCAKLGVSDTANVKSSEQLYHKMYDLLKRSTSTTHDGASDNALHAGIPVPVLEEVFQLDVDASSKTKDFSAFRDDFLNEKKEIWISRLDKSASYKTYSKYAAENVDTCLRTVAGLWGYFTPSPNYQGFSFEFRYRPHVTEKNQFRGKGATLSPKDAVSDCQPGNPDNLLNFQPGKEKPNPQARLSFHCIWRDPTKDILVTIYTEQESNTFTLGGIIPPAERNEPDLAHKMQSGCHFMVSFDNDANVPGMLLARNYNYVVWYNSGSRIWHNDGPALRENGGTTPAGDSLNIPNWDPVEKHNQFVLFDANFGFQPNGRVDRGGQINILPNTCPKS